MIWHLVLLFGFVGLALLTNVNISIKVFARRSVVVPAGAFLSIRLLLDTDLLLKLVDACLVFVRLLLVVCGALLGRDRSFVLLCLLFQIFLLSSACLTRIADRERSGLLASENACIVYIHVERKLFLLESDFLLRSEADRGFLPVPRFVLIFPRISFSHDTVEI